MFRSIRSIFLQTLRQLSIFNQTNDFCNNDLAPLKYFVKCTISFSWRNLRQHQKPCFRFLFRTFSESQILAPMIINRFVPPKCLMFRFDVQLYEGSSSGPTARSCMHDAYITTAGKSGRAERPPYPCIRLYRSHITTDNGRSGWNLRNGKIFSKGKPEIQPWWCWVSFGLSGRHRTPG